MNPGGGSGWDEPPLDIQIPDDARELDREVLAYHREMRAQRRRNRLRRLAGPLAGQGTLMPLLASILAVCLVAGAMLSVATFSPATAPGNGQTARPGTSASAGHSGPQSTAPARPSAATSAATGSARTSAHRDRFGQDQPHRDRFGQDQPHRDQPDRNYPRRDRPGQPLSGPFGLAGPAEFHRLGVRVRLSRNPALTRGGVTATIFFRPAPSGLFR